jgi:Ca2+/Na+ antiporter
VIASRLLSAWDAVLGSAALLAIIILTLSLMVGAVPPRDAPRHLGVILGIVILLVMLPAIVLSSWNSLDPFQQAGIVFLGIVVAYLLTKRGGGSKRARHK